MKFSIEVAQISKTQVVWFLFEKIIIGSNTFLQVSREKDVKSTSMIVHLIHAGTVVHASMKLTATDANVIMVT